MNEETVELVKEPETGLRTTEGELQAGTEGTTEADAQSEAEFFQDEKEPEAA